MHALAPRSVALDLADLSFSAVLLAPLPVGPAPYFGALFQSDTHGDQIFGAVSDAPSVLVLAAGPPRDCEVGRVGKWVRLHSHKFVVLHRLPFVH